MNNLCGRCDDYCEIANTKEILYQIHVTIRPWGVSFGDFQTDCTFLGIKAVSVENYTPNGKIILDWFTSSVVKESLLKAWGEMTRISKSLRGWGYSIVRTKIETVPWNCRVPVSPPGPLRHWQYFEAHIKVLNTDNKIYSIALDNDWLVSKNSDRINCAVVTLRRKTYREEFDKELRSMMKKLDKFGYLLGNPIIEWTIYDSNLEHDNEWIGK